MGLQDKKRRWVWRAERDLKGVWSFELRKRMARRGRGGLTG